jgi:hypothetical protein
MPEWNLMYNGTGKREHLTPTDELSGPIYAEFKIYDARDPEKVAKTVKKELKGIVTSVKQRKGAGR